MQSLTDPRPPHRRLRLAIHLLCLAGLLILGSWMLACSSGAEPAPRNQSATSKGETAADETAEATSCEGLDQTPCRKSPDCTLVQDESAESGYRCRAAEGPCEEGFRQEGSSREECENREGCRFQPANCYCPPEVTCVCGGGPPSRCAGAAEPSAAPSS